MNHETLEDEVARLKLELSKAKAAGRAALRLEREWRLRCLLGTFPEEPEPEPRRRRP